MRSTIFYFFFFLYTVIRLVLTLVIRVTAFATVAVLVITAIDNSWLSSLWLVVFLATVSLTAFVARAKYVTLLLKLQPPATDYTFYQ